MRGIATGAGQGVRNTLTPPLPLARERSLRRIATGAANAVRNTLTPPLPLARERSMKGRGAGVVLVPILRDAPWGRSSG